MPVRVQREDFDAGAEITRLRAKDPKVGAVAAFVVAQRRQDNAAWHALGVLYIGVPALSLMALRLFSPVNGSLVVMGLFPVGAVVGGVLGNAIGPRWTLVVAGCLLLVCPVVLWSALRGVREVGELAEAAEA